MARRQRDLRLPAPYLKHVRLDKTKVADAAAYPFCIPLFKNDFEIRFVEPITIVVGENGTGKSTLIEALAALVGFDEAGGAKGYRHRPSAAATTTARYHGLRD